MIAISQDINVKGKVIDENGNPLPGVTIKIKNTKNGTISDGNGEFSLKNVPEDAILSAFYVGYTAVEIKVSSVITIKMIQEPGLLDDVVVVGYGTQKKVNLTGAIASVDGKALESRPITNIGQGLQGLIPNLNITVGNGKPGSGSEFNIRGITSINGGTPLILVDGVQMDPNLINPNNVENVTVLKDASASAIYGVRAAYGVVLITTKKGKKKHPGTSYLFIRLYTNPANQVTTNHELG
ncbi:TonB-dependent receptor plug domain-containing protein [Pedobacter lusitanus]|uniref:TonB-dependent receptor plug domain-containing protein n=1 Tax=Pedobacter lusitanus TaxID=1503925 RepID=UPI00190FB17B|nr:TonB-dependent receptor plug domain-containing protein [Pedobacter lusitanus]